VSEVKLEDIVSLAKRRGFIYQGSEVYGGLSGTWDYGPLGVTLKRNIMNLWWKMFVDTRDDMYGVDAAILMNQKVWQASGHADTFTDPITFCKHCDTRYRVDKIVKDDYKKYIEEVLLAFYKEQEELLQSKDALVRELDAQNDNLAKVVQEDYDQLTKLIQTNIRPEVYEQWLEGAMQRVKTSAENYHRNGNIYAQLSFHLNILENIRNIIKDALQYVGQFAKQYLDTYIECEKCRSKNYEWSVPVKFNMMFKTQIGPVADAYNISYLRPETAQGIFTNFKNVVDSFYPDLPFGIAQQGKAFRNEISPRDFVFRAREFEQMEIEYFIAPENWEEEFNKWVTACKEWFKALGLPEDKVHELKVPTEDRAHYSKRTIDFEFDYPIGREELMGLAYRTDFDLGNIQRVSGKSMEYTIKGTNTRFVPHVIEPSFGVERALMAVLCSAYREDEQGGEKRVYLALPEHLAPVKYCVSPLLKNKPELVAKAREVYEALKAKHGNVMWDDNGNIGKRYRRQDEIGTPHCVVIDFQTLEDGTVTVRDRDTTEQKRVSGEDMR
jgi:glycyl-tRNA synthetase